MTDAFSNFELQTKGFTGSIISPPQFTPDLRSSFTAASIWLLKLAGNAEDGGVNPGPLAVTSTGGFLTVEAEVESGGLLKPGLFATARIAQSKPEPAVLIPARAVRTDGGVTKVFVIENGWAIEKLVQVGDTENDLIQIKTGLKENEEVAVSNIEQLFDGVTVRQ